ncbi:MAG TPA: hypothetical protein VGG20_16925 [Thermoanaerobaculia bacterium]|jgi:hypothetical protein
MRHSLLLRLAAVPFLLALPAFLPLARAESPNNCVQHGICADCTGSEGQRLCTFLVCDGTITGLPACGGCFDECVPFP